MRIIFLHGNGGCKANMHWYEWADRQLSASGMTVIRETLPDNEVAHEAIWIPFIRDELKADENSILVGHSSGAIAAMRYAETYPIKGSVLVSGYYTHLGDDNEKAGGWFDRPWNWEKIRHQQDWIIQFASVDDPWIPIEEPRFIRDQLKSEYYEFNDRGHFIGPRDSTTFPELVEAVRKRQPPQS